jgi:hypothetical protein
MRIARDPFKSWLEVRLVRPTRTLVLVRAVGKVLKLLDRSDTFHIENNFLSIQSHKPPPTPLGTTSFRVRDTSRAWRGLLSVGIYLGEAW